MALVFVICYMFVCVVPSSHARARGKSASEFSFILCLFNASRLIADVWQFNYNERAIPRKVKCKYKGRNQPLWGSMDGFFPSLSILIE